ncbi:MAG: peptide-methionine (S)-S-oxide reductase MsrA [Bacteroidia bacterium]
MVKKLIFTIALLQSFLFSACGQSTGKGPATDTTKTKKAMSAIQATDTATFGAGCFWCVEAVFQQLKGVISVTSGYSGGSIKNPSYKEVCMGTTGHAEVCQIVYDSNVVSFDELLEVFWQTHDPTTLNRQGNDVGTQYRSVIFYHNEKQKERAEFYKKKLNESGAWDNPVVTEISPFTVFYKAEDYHQNYYNQNGDQPYCQYVIRPKVEKFQKVFKDKLNK